MESSVGLRPSASVASRISAIDVGQLDKINAIPNKTTNDVLLDGLCLEDQLYLDTLLDDDSTDSDSQFDNSGSPWAPPMAPGQPMTLNMNMNMSSKKRLKMKMKPQYAITMSLEDISYIRPSWGMSKSIKKIEVANSNKAARGKLNKALGGGGGGGVGARDNKAIKIDELDREKGIEAGESEQKRLVPPINPYHLFLTLAMLVVLILMISSYLIDVRRNKERTYHYRIELHPSERAFNIFKQRDGLLLRGRGLRVNYGQGIPGNLRHETCSCDMYDQETRKYFQRNSNNHYGNHFVDQQSSQHGDCFACFDWAHRANMQMFVNRSHYNSLLVSHQHAGMLEEDSAITCYDVKWQSYDTLATPLVDCFQMGDEQWFGLGDLQAPQVWPLNKFDQADDEFVPLLTNLSATSHGLLSPYSRHGHGHGQQRQQQHRPDSDQTDSAATNPAHETVTAPNFGSQVDFSLLTSNGFFVGNLRTDLQASIRISARRREICLSVVCSDKCSRLWTRRDENAVKFRLKNNVLEYTVCSANSWRLLSLRLVDERTQRLAERAASFNETSSHQPVNIQTNNERTAPQNQLKLAPAPTLSSTPATPTTIEVEQQSQQAQRESSPRVGSTNQLTPNSPNQQQLIGNNNNNANNNRQTAAAAPRAEPIGLVERTLFITSPEFVDILDGSTLRQHVDKIVKLNLKTSPILVLDTRWQNHVGSFKLNAALFPKAKLLFEILHNKGFKIILTVKPYIDVNIGISNLKQLLDNKRLVTIQYENELLGGDRQRLAKLGKITIIDDSQGRKLQGSKEDAQNKDESDEERFISSGLAANIIRRRSFFRFENEEVLFKDQLERLVGVGRRKPYLFQCKESYGHHCVLIDLMTAENRAWMLDLIKRSSFLSQEADGILLAGNHPDSYHWDAHYRGAMSTLVDELFYREHLFALPQWTGNFNYVQLAHRQRDWDSLRSIVDSVLNLGMQGFALIHPGSVWGDIKQTVAPRTAQAAAAPQGASSAAGLDANGVGGALMFDPLAGKQTPSNSFQQRQQQQQQLDGQPSDEQLEEELVIRWLQVAVFLPILQFNDLAPIERFQLHDQLQALVRIRKLFVVPEIKKHLPYTPLINPNLDEFKAARAVTNQQQLAALRYTWNANVPVTEPAQSQGGGGGWLANEAIGQQFMIGADLLVAPVLQENQRQKDIYLPAGIWHDELRKLNIRGGKWLRNYPIELNEIAWFTRARR